MKKIFIFIFNLFFVINLFAQNTNNLTPQEIAYNVGYEDGTNNTSYNFKYKGKNADLELKEQYELGNWQGKITYYYNEGIKIGLRQYSSVPSDYQYADSWGEPVELVNSFKSGIEEGTKKYSIENDLKSKFSEAEYDAIIHATVFIGMSEEALIASHGEPNKINYTVLKDFEQKQYVYNRPFHRNEYIYVENGLITGYQYF